jgi:hypothetical protein
MMKRRLPGSLAPALTAFLISGVMTLLVSMVATARGIGVTAAFPGVWMQAWLLSWAVAFPALFVVMPAVRRIVGWLCRTR